jgi:Predicted GTPase
MNKDTIVANATPLIPSAISIVRISGDKALEIGKKYSLCQKNNSKKSLFW